jgi:hypothetical protein
MNDARGTGRGTRVRSAELDWSHVHETMLMLELAAGQIDAAMTESSSSVDVLTGTFTAMAGSLAAIRAGLAGLPDDGAVGERKAALLADAREVDGTAQQAIIAFQFYDRLSQRLSHVCHSLADLSSLVADGDRALRRDEWVKLQESIRSKYTSAEEREMFEAALAGVPVRETVPDVVLQRADEVVLVDLPPTELIQRLKEG